MYVAMATSFEQTVLFYVHDELFASEVHIAPKIPANFQVSSARIFPMFGAAKILT